MIHHQLSLDIKLQHGLLRIYDHNLITNVTAHLKEMLLFLQDQPHTFLQDQPHTHRSQCTVSAAVLILLFADQVSDWVGRASYNRLCHSVT